MPGLVPGIHALLSLLRVKTWMAGTSPAMTDKWVKPDGNGPGTRDPSASVAHACVPLAGPRLMIVATICGPRLPL